MKTHSSSCRRDPRGLAFAITFACTLIGGASHAAIDVKNIPLKMAETVQPNILFILDDSGSMEYVSMPTDRTSLSDSPTQRGSAVNTIYYNPLISYRGWRKADDTYMPDTPAVSAYADESLASTNDTVNLTTSDQIFYVLKAGATDLNSNSSYKRYVLKRNNAGMEECERSGNIWSCKAITTLPWQRNGATPTVQQEWQNYANWYSYHRTRMKVAKAGAAEAFGGLAKGDYRVGLDTIWTGRGGTGLKYPIPVGTSNGIFSEENRTAWFNTLFNVQGSGRTPLIPSLMSAGEYYRRSDSAGPYGGTLTADNSQMKCRQNFTILTTDGYWNEGANAFTQGNVDNTVGVDVTRTPPKTGTENTYPEPKAPYKDSWSNTLADVAMYYWKNDLRTDMENYVPVTVANPAFWQHMVTFGVSIGLKGSIDPETDMAALRAGTKEWPDPISSGEGPARIDDLLHAAVNGRGSFVAASNPEAFKQSLQAALATISNLVYSRSNVSANSTALRQGTHVYQASYTGGSWTGDLKAYPVEVDATTHEERVGTTPVWSAGPKITYSTTRKVLSEGGTFPTAAAAATLNAVDTDLIAYLKGDSSKELKNAGGKFRNRESLLGDIVYSSPAFVEGNIPLTGLDTDDTVYVGANDGMLHAFNADNGEERFAYVPGGLNFSRLAEVASPTYPHYFFVDGPVVVSTREQTRTTQYPNGRNILIGTLGRGGKGMYAIDVTDSSSPNPLWDNTWSDAVGTGSAVDAKATSAWEAEYKKTMAHITTAPFITRTNDGSLAVITGNGLHLKDSNNNVTTGEVDQAALFVINLETGAIIKEIRLPGTDNTLSAPRGWDQDRDGDVDYVYAGDLQGNVWKFDLSSNKISDWDSSYKSGNTPAPWFTAYGPDGKRQPISGGVTVAVNPQTYERMVLFGTGRFLTDGDPGDRSVQTIYGLIDNNNKLPIGTRSADLTQRKIVTEEVVKGADGVDRLVRGFEPANAPIAEGDRGWFMDLLKPSGTSSVAEGERVFGQPRNEAGVLLITSGIPSGDPCNPTGSGFIYAIDAFTGAALPEQYWDTNGDGKVDAADNVGKGSAGGIGHNNMLTDSLTLTGSDGQGQVYSGDFVAGGKGVGNKSQMATGRISWREILRN